MLSATHPPAARQDSPISQELRPTRLFLEEHDWLHALTKSAHNQAPAFRFPDLVSACISHVFQHSDASVRLFRYLHAVMTRRPADTPRRQTDVWAAHFDQLICLQRSAANQYPHPRFQLDQITTACVALARSEDERGLIVLSRARANVSLRASLHSPATP
jgi:hypothetical protein